MTRRDVLTTIRAIGAIASYIPDTGEYRVTLPNVSRARAERCACYTDDAQDAIGTARAMMASQIQERRAIESLASLGFKFHA